MAAGPTYRRPARGTGGATAAGPVPHFLRAHVHESEGCAVCRRDGDPDAGACPAGRGISLPLAAHYSHRRSWRGPVDRLPDSRLPRHGADLALVDHGGRQSLSRPDLLLALLREAVEGNVRRRAGVGAGYAVVVSADPVRTAASRNTAWSGDRRCRRHVHV